jgi:hypothetical protein
MLALNRESAARPGGSPVRAVLMVSARLRRLVHMIDEEFAAVERRIRAYQGQHFASRGPGVQFLHLHPKPQVSGAAGTSGAASKIFCYSDVTGTVRLHLRGCTLVRLHLKVPARDAQLILGHSRLAVTLGDLPT